MPCAHCRREILTDGAIASDGRAVHRRCELVPGSQRRAVDTDAYVSAILSKLRATAASAASTSTPAPPRRLHVVSASTTVRRAGGAGVVRDDGDAIASEIAAELGTIATGARMQSWARQLAELADEIGTHAARDDLAVLRRIAARFATTGARLAGAA